MRKVLSLLWNTMDNYKLTKTSKPFGHCASVVPRPSVHQSITMCRITGAQPTWQPQGLTAKAIELPLKKNKWKGAVGPRLS